MQTPARHRRRVVCSRIVIVISSSSSSNSSSNSSSSIARYCPCRRCLPFCMYMTCVPARRLSLSLTHSLTPSHAHTHTHTHTLSLYLSPARVRIHCLGSQRTHTCASTLSIPLRRFGPGRSASIVPLTIYSSCSLCPSALPCCPLAFSIPCCSPPTPGLLLQRKHTPANRHRQTATFSEARPSSPPPARCSEAAPSPRPTGAHCFVTSFLALLP